MTTAAVVLAAGEGRRFLGPSHKLLAPFRGRPLVTWAIEAALGSGCDEVLVVTGAVAVPEYEGARQVRNERWPSGQASSLQVAVAAAIAAGHAAVVVGLGDQPLVPASAWAAVAATTTTPIAVGDFGGRRVPPVRLERSVWALLPAVGDEGARRLLRGRPELVTAVPCCGEPVDIDTVEDLDRWS